MTSPKVAERKREKNTQKARGLLQGHEIVFFYVFFSSTDAGFGSSCTCFPLARFWNLHPGVGEGGRKDVLPLLLQLLQIGQRLRLVHGGIRGARLGGVGLQLLQSPLLLLG